VELGLRPLARGPFLTELLLRRGERVSLARQGVLSPSASLAFSSAWLYQARSPSRAARSC
jgi:hypothetical protein